jgi:hypothetical protein
MTITPETWVSIGLTFLSTLAGGVITWIAAHKYYVRAAKEMEAETKYVQNLLRISLQAMEDTKMVKLNRDASGKITGMVHELSAHAVTTSFATVTLSVSNESQENQQVGGSDLHPQHTEPS